MAGMVAAGAAAQGAIRLGDASFDVDTIYHVTTGPGIQTTALRLTDPVSKSATNVFYTSVDLRNPDLELRGVQALDKECGSEDVLSMGRRRNGLNDGTVYVAGVNGDHANLNGTAKRTNGAAVIDGLLYNHGVGDDGWKRFGSYVAVEDSKDVTITGALEVKMPLYFPNGGSQHLYINSPRHENYLVLYTPEYGASTKTNPWGRECALRLVEGSVVGGDAVFEVTSQWIGDLSGNTAHGNMAIPADGYVLSGNGSGYSLIGTLSPGTRLRLNGFTTIIDGRETKKAGNVIGGCPVIVSDGQAITQAECTDLNKTTQIQITPTARTAIGIDNSHGMLYMLVADYYKENGCTTGDKANYGATSAGLDFVRLAQLMMHLGCDTATAMDGGGSSQLYNMERGICNIPYGLASYLRPVANGFFASVRVPADSEIAYIEAVQKNVRLSSGETFTPKVYGYNRHGVLVDTDVKNFSLTVCTALGTVRGTEFKAGSTSGTTKAVISAGNIRCGVDLTVNGGGEFISSGADAPTEVRPPYLPADPAGETEITDDFTDSHTPLYFNLKGYPVTESYEGICIEQRGDKARKIIK